MTKAGINVMVSSHASKMPRVTNIPNTLTGGLGVSASEANPAAEVRLVYSIGLNRSAMTCRRVSRRSLKDG